MYSCTFFFFNVWEICSDLWGEVWGWGPLKGEKRRKEAIERGLPGGPGAALTAPLTAFVPKLFSPLLFIIMNNRKS